MFSLSIFDISSLVCGSIGVRWLENYLNYLDRCGMNYFSFMLMTVLNWALLSLLSYF